MESKELGVIYALIGRMMIAEHVDFAEYPLEVRQILREFRELVGEELPHGLPPMRSIQHAIDLLPGAALPNLPAYRMPPAHRTEMQRQVEELITKGLVCESKSPCVLYSRRKRMVGGG